jgi:hypothetical protein
MASTVKHLRSSTANKRPTASGLSDGQLGINTASGTPGIFFKDSAGTVTKVGPVHVGSTAPNVSPAGSAGNSRGELWVNNSTTINGLNYYTGSAFVNLTPSGTTTVAGLVELATNAETQTGTDTVRAVTPSGLQSKVSNSTSTTSSTTIASSTAVKAAYDLADAALPKSGGRVTGALEIGPVGSLVFEGSSDDSFETTIAVVNPTAARTITFPNVTGTVITTGDTGTVTSTMIANSTIVDADINASAEIAVSKLADGAARQLLQTDAAGTGVEWTNNVDIPGTLDVTGATVLDGDLTIPDKIIHAGDTNTAIRFPAADTIAFETDGSERSRIDSFGRLLVGTSSYINVWNTSQKLILAGGATTGIGIASAGGSSIISMARSSGTDPAAFGLVASGDVLGILNWNGGDGSSSIAAARIQAAVDGTPGANDMPGRLVFSTTADEASSPTERMRLDSSGRLLVGTTASGAFVNISANTTEDALRVTQTGTGNALVVEDVANPDASPFVIDGNGRVTQGHTTALSLNGTGGIPSQQLNTATSTLFAAACYSAVNWGNNTAAPGIFLAKARAGAVENYAIVPNNQILGQIRFAGADGVQFQNAGSIGVEVDGTTASGVMPGRIVFATVLSGTTTSSEVLRLTNDSVIAYNQAAPEAVDTTATLTVAQLKNGLITSAPASGVTMTLPTGTDTQSGFNGTYTGMAFQWSVINTGPNTVTISGATGHTVIGSSAVASGVSGRFTSRRSANNTFVSYRLS